jgi:hypothetical protein
MENNVHKQLGPEEIAALSSVYIDRGVKQDAWEILEIDIDGALLRARIRMTAFFVSPTDPGGFHLTIFSTQEFLAQLANIYLHVAAGFETKCRETWMRECAISSRKVIRDPENIRVEIDFFGQKQLGDSLAAMANGRVYDDQGGLFTARLKGLLRA